MVLQNSDDQGFSNNTDGWALSAGNTSVRTLTLSGADFPLLLSSPATNNILQFNGTNWVNVAASTFGTGSVTNIATGTGLTGGPITNTGTISMAVSGVTAGTYGAGTSFPQITVDALGRVLAATTIALGSIASQGSNSVNITGGTITGLPTPTNASDAVNKSYVDNATAGLTAKAAVRLATSGANLASTYNNGASGVGATITLTATGALSVDGSAVIVGDRILVKDQTSALQNGIYSVTVAGAAGTSAVLTRTTDFNSTATVFDGAYAVVEEGTVNKGTLWIVTFTGDQSYTIGTTAINFTELSVANQTVTLTGDITGSGAGSIATTLATVNANVGSFGNTTNIPTITVNAKGLITAISNTAITYGTGSVTSVATGTGLTGGPVTTTGTVSVATNGISNGLFRQSLANTLVGNPTGATANVTDITLGATLAFVTGSLQTVALTGDVTTSANSFATTIASNAVTNAKFRQSAALSVVGNATNATANVADITATASSNQVLMVSAAGTTLTWNTIQTANIANSAVTYAKIQNETASTLLGNPNGTTQAPQEITLGTGLVFTGTTLAIGTTGVTAGTYNGLVINAQGQVTSATTQSFAWVTIAGTTQTAVVNTGYFPNNAALCTITLPTTAAVGDIVRIGGKGAGGWKLAQVAGQTVHFGNKNTTTGTGGSLQSNNQYHCVELVCMTANTDFLVLSSMGNITVT